MNLRDKRTQSDDKLRETIKRRRHVSRENTKLPNSSKLALVSSGIVRRSRNYRVRGQRGGNDDVPPKLVKFSMVVLVKN